MAALIARRFQIVDWVRAKKEIWSNTSAWGQRAIIWSSSVLPRNERNHWLKGIANYPVLGTAMLAEANVGFLFRAPKAIQEQFPQFKAVEEYRDLMALIKAEL